MKFPTVFNAGLSIDAYNGMAGLYVDVTLEWAALFVAVHFFA